MRSCFVVITVSAEPTCELDTRRGGDYVGLSREKRGGGQGYGHTLGQSHQLYRAFGVAAVTVLEVCGTPAATPLQGAVSVRLTTYAEKNAICGEKTEKGKCSG